MGAALFVASVGGLVVEGPTPAAPVKRAVRELSLSLPRRSYRRGEIMPLTVVSQGAGSVELLLKPRGQEDNPEAAHLVNQVPAGKEQKVNFATAEVRPGRYVLTATLRDNAGDVRTTVDVPVAIVAHEVRGVSLGVLDVPAEMLTPDRLAALVEAGFDIVYFPFTDPTNPDRLRDELDACYAEGLLAAPLIEAEKAIHWNDTLTGPRSPAAIQGNDWGQVLKPSGTVAYDADNYPILCPRNPKAMALIERYVKKLGAAAARHPGVWAVVLDRDAALAYDWRGGGAGCFCRHCVDFFRNKTGKDAPAPDYVPPGHVAEAADPLPAWLLLLGEPGGFGGGTRETYNRRLKKILGELDPTLKVAELPGGYAGELDTSTYVVNFESAPTLETKLAYVLDLARARQRNARKPITLVFTGLKPGENRMNPGKHLQALSSIAVSRGVQSLVFSPYKAVADKAVASTMTDIKSTIASLGPMLTKLTPVRMPIAVLYSGTTEGYQRFLRWKEAKDRWVRAKKWFEEPWEQEHSFYLGYSALLRTGLPVEVVTEQDVLGGRLADYQALVLIDHKYSTRALEERIRDFQKSGKLVFADLSSVVHPPQVITIPTDFSVWSQMIPLGLRNPDPAVADIVRERQDGLIREAAYYVGKVMTGRVKSPVEITPSQVLYSLAVNGPSRYLLLVNPDPQNAVRADVKLDADEEFIYDLLVSKRVDVQRTGPRIAFTLDMPPASLHAYLLSPREITHLRIQTKQARQKLSVDIIVGGAAGLRVSGSHPLRITVLDPQGQEQPASGYYATDGGRLHLDIPLAKNEAVGPWKITVAELASGLVRSQTIEVK